MEVTQNQLKVPAYLPFNHVKFVSANKSVPTDERKSSPAAFLSEQLDGQEVSDFYKALVSSSSSPGPKSKEPKHLKPSGHKTPLNICTKSVSGAEVVQGRKKANFLHCVQEGKSSEVLKCISEGCDPNQRDRFQWTALMIAVCAGHETVVKCLLEEGADPGLRNSQGWTALDIAKKQDVDLDIQLLLHPEKVQHVDVQEVKPQEESGTKYCCVCKREYEDSQQKHENSIAHLFNCGPRPFSTFYHIPESNKGFQMMLKEGWDKNKGLGPSGKGQKFPVKTVLRKDRSCIGSTRKTVPRITHFEPYDVSAVRRVASAKPVLVRERTLKKREREKLARKNRQKEIAFRRQFFNDDVL